MSTKTYSTEQAAAILGLTDSRIRQLCRSGEIQATLRPVVMRLAWQVSEAALNKAKRDRHITTG